MDYHINQTPYSIYFSIRKKFVKDYKPNCTENQALQEETNDKEIFYIKNEYAKLYDHFQTSIANENFLKSDIEKLVLQLENKEVLHSHVSQLEESKKEDDVQNNVLRTELREIKIKYDAKVEEIKVLKDENNALKKENNSASVAIK